MDEQLGEKKDMGLTYEVLDRVERKHQSEPSDHQTYQRPNEKSLVVRRPSLGANHIQQAVSLDVKRASQHEAYKDEPSDWEAAFGPMRKRVVRFVSPEGGKRA